LLKKLFWGHRGCGMAACGMAACGSCGGCDACGTPVAGCDTCGGSQFVPSEGMMVPAGSSDPFVDDARVSASAFRAKTYRTASVPQPPRRRLSLPTPERVTVSNARALNVASVEPMKAAKKSPTLAEPMKAAKKSPTLTESTRKTKSTVRPASSDTSDVKVPGNPLRD
jgi:hypothetical protein